MILQRDGSPGHSLHSIYDFCLLSGRLEGGAKSCKYEAIPGFALAASGATKKPINCPSIRSSAELSIVHSAAPGRDLCCALGNRESFGNRARQPKGCAADTAAGPA